MNVIMTANVALFWALSGEGSAPPLTETPKAAAATPAPNTATAAPGAAPGAVPAPARPRVEVVTTGSSTHVSPSATAPTAKPVQGQAMGPSPSPNGSSALPPEFKNPSAPPQASAPSPASPAAANPSLAAPSVAPSSSGHVVALTDAEPATPLPGDSSLASGPTSGPSAGRRAGPVFENNARMRTAILREPPMELVYVGERKAPQRTALMTFGYRHFAVVDGLERHQGWHMLTIEVTPLRRYFRLNFATELGIEGGDAAANHDRGDFMAMEKLGLGLQYPGWITPFVEFQGGAGVGRIELFDRNDLGIILSTGTDVGVQWAVARGLFVSACVGWLRPVIMTTEQSLDNARAFNRGTFKVGVGF